MVWIEAESRPDKIRSGFFVGIDQRPGHAKLTGAGLRRYGCGQLPVMHAIFSCDADFVLVSLPP
jgi:hypothetical protein